MNRYGCVKLVIVLLISVILVFGTAGYAWAETGAGTAGIGDTAGSAAGIGEGTRNTDTEITGMESADTSADTSADIPTVSNTDSGSSAITEIPAITGNSASPGNPAPAVPPATTVQDASSPAGDAAQPDRDQGGETPGERDLTADGYEIYAVGGSKDTLESLRKGRQAKVIVYVKSQDIKTKDVSKSSISAAKLHDSFRGSTNPKIKITSEKEDNLEFTVTFSKITYLGTGDELKFRVSYKKAGIPSDIVSVNIMECEESGYSGANGGSDTNGQPVIRIKRTSPQAPVGPGTNFTLVLDLENTSSDADIEDLVVNINPGSALFITEDTNARLVKRLDTNKTAEIRLNMTAGQELTGPSQVLELDLKYSYYSGGGLTSGSSTQKVLIPVKGGSASGQPMIRVSRGELGSPIQAGQAFSVMIRLENASKEREIRNLTATFESNDQISLLDQTDTRMIGDMAPGQTVDVPVRLQAGAELSNAASQLLGLNVKFDYDSDKGTVQGTYGEKIVIPTAGGQGKAGAPTPNIIITNYTYGEMVTAGQVFDLEMELTNTSGQQPVENVVVSLDTGEGISINSSSNTFYIPRLGAGEAKKARVKVQALFQSKLQSPKIAISLKYEYMDKNERKQTSSSETIAIPVYQPDRFELKQPVYSENLRQGEEGTISIPYVNKGRGQVFNVEADLELDIRALEKNLTAGNFESGRSGTLDFVITPQRSGSFEGQVKVSYEDEAMQVKTVTVPVTFTVQETRDVSSEVDGEEAGQTSEPDRRWRKPAAAFAALAAVIIFFAAVCRKKKLKNMHLRENDLVYEAENGDTWEDEEIENEADVRERGVNHEA